MRWFSLPANSALQEPERGQGPGLTDHTHTHTLSIFEICTWITYKVLSVTKYTNNELCTRVLQFNSPLECVVGISLKIPLPAGSGKVHRRRPPWEHTQALSQRVNSGALRGHQCRMFAGHRTEVPQCGLQTPSTTDRNTQTPKAFS